MYWLNILFDKFSVESMYIPSDCRRNTYTLDFFLTNIEQHLSNPKVINDLGSDQFPVCTYLNHTYQVQEDLIYNYNETNWKRYANSIQ